MQVQLKKATVVNGSVYLAGNLADLPEAMAQALITIGIAEAVSVETDAKQADETPVGEIRTDTAEKRSVNHGKNHAD